ncbi:MAG TPA: hypothetical protein ENH75_04765, partial [archaeon]|nr:hypothetical protein [archaeon]
MRLNESIFEERITTIRQTSQIDNKSLKEYVSSCISDYYPELEKAGARVICLFQGIIGIPTNVYLQITLYPDIDKYYQIQSQ